MIRKVVVAGLTAMADDLERKAHRRLVTRGILGLAAVFLLVNSIWYFGWLCLPVYGAIALMIRLARVRVIRRSLVVLSSVAVIWLGLFSLASTWGPLCWEFHHQPSSDKWVRVVAFDGKVEGSYEWRRAGRSRTMWRFPRTKRNFGAFHIDIDHWLQRQPITWTYGSFGFPIWPLLVLFAYPTIAFIRGPLRRYRRRKHGLCLQCGYNLTGNTSGVCPECGTEVET